MSFSSPLSSRPRSSAFAAPPSSSRSVFSTFTSASNGAAARTTSNSSFTMRGIKRTRSEMQTSTDDARDATARQLGAAAHATSAKRLGTVDLTEEEEREYKRWKYEPDPNIAAQAAAYSIAHFDPDHEYELDPERSPPQPLRWWEKAAAKLRPGLHIRDIGINPLLSFAEEGFTKPTKHPRWYLPTGDVAINVENCIFRVHRHILRLHVREERYDVVKSTPGQYVDAESGETIPMYTWSCEHHILREAVRVNVRAEAEEKGWAHESAEELELLLRRLDILDHEHPCNCVETPRNISLLCQMVYSPRTFFNRGCVYFEDLERMLVMSRSFRSLRLRDCAIAGLSLLFPTSLQQYVHPQRNNIVRLIPATYAIDALRLSIDHNIPAILLTAMYTLSNFQHRFLIHGIFDPTRSTQWETKLEDNSVTIGGEITVRTVSRTPKKLRLLDLSPDQEHIWADTMRRNHAEREAAAAASPPRVPNIVVDPGFDQCEILARILKGRAHMQVGRREVMLGALRDIPSFPDDVFRLYDNGEGQTYQFSEHCSAPTKLQILDHEGVWLTCAQALKGSYTAACAAEAEEFSDNRYLELPRRALHMPLMTKFRGTKEMHVWHEFCCSSCKTKVKRELRLGQFELWKKLPKYFGMKGWFDIEELQRRFNEDYARRYLGADFNETDESGWEQGLYQPNTSHLDDGLTPAKKRARLCN